MGDGGQIKDVNVAELRGLWESLYWATYKILAQLIWVEGDSLNIITSLKEIIEQGGSSSMLDCKNMLQRSKNVFREANSGADWLSQS